MKKEKLIECFKHAKDTDYKYIAVIIKNEDLPKNEVIIDKIENYEEKLNYYINAYDDNLILKSNNKIQITFFTFGDTFEDIEDDLYFYMN